MIPRSPITTLPGAVRWSILVQPFEHTSPLIEMDADRVCATASIGKVLLGKTGRRLGMRDTALHDIVRDHRLSQHPPSLSSGPARELVQLCRVLEEADGVSAGVAATVIGWLSTNTDLSMVGAAWGLDPRDTDDPTRDDVLTSMKGLGELIRGSLTGAPSR